MAKKKKKLFSSGILVFVIFLISGFLIFQLIEKTEQINRRNFVKKSDPQILIKRGGALPEAFKKDKIAILIDDLGPNLMEFHQIKNLHPNLSFAVLPFQPFSNQIAKEIQSGGHHDLLLHLPMEADDDRENPGKGAIYQAMKPEEIATQTRLDLRAIRDIQGVNNHMGSKITSDQNEMRIILNEIKEKRLYFIDSKTTSSSVAYSLAGKMGIKSAERQVFLDNTDDFKDIVKEFDHLVDLAHQRGRAIAIGHPRPNTIRALKNFIPYIDKKSVELVPVSSLVH